MEDIITGNNYLAMPSQFKFRNGVWEYCDMVQGPCACGAYHYLEDWPIEVQAASLDLPIRFFQ